MKLLSIIIASFIVTISSHWETNMNTAQKKAREQHKLILLNFSGSDWCGPCIRMHKDIFENAAFQDFADTTLVLLNADFPRLKKNRVSQDLERQNDLLAEKYNTKGIFPLTVLMDADGHTLKSWEGLPKQTAAEFAKEIDNLTHAKTR
jgi:thioredoxin-related protein